MKGYTMNTTTETVQSWGFGPAQSTNGEHTMPHEINNWEFSTAYIDAMIEATPNEYYARLCALVGA